MRELPTRRAPVLVVLALAATGCATAGASVARDPSTVSVMTGDGATLELRRGSDIRVNQRVTATRDAAWAVLPAVYRAIGIEPDVHEPSAWRLGVSRQRFSGRVLDRPASDFFDCGMDPGLNRPLADQMPVDAQVVTELVATDVGTELHTTVQGTARRSGGNAGVATCRTTGLMEVLIGEMVQRMASEG